MKKIIGLIALLITINAKSQDDKTVTLTVTGQGKTIEEAKQNALRSAIEQAFGTFVSSKTEILNDKLLKDEIITISNGNIQKFNIINEIPLPSNDGYLTTINATVSLNKLTSFCESKGVVVEFKGGLFATNIKIQKINEQAELNVICKTIGFLHETIQTSFDYIMENGKPQSVNENARYWRIPITVTAMCNKNIEICADYFIKTLRAISLSEIEIAQYREINKKVIPIEVNYNGKDEVYYLRKSESLNAIRTFCKNWKFYLSLFVIECDSNKIYGNIENAKQLHYLWSNKDFFGSRQLIRIEFPKTGKVVGKFELEDQKNLSQIENITSYKVSPRGIVSLFRFGGYVLRQPIDGNFKIGILVNKENRVEKLLSKFPAEISGIKIGDVIQSINDTVYYDMKQIEKSSEKGKDVKIQLKRDAQLLVFKITPLYIKPIKGIVASPFSFESKQYDENSKVDWEDVKSACKSLIIDGYNDWQLPTIEDLRLMRYISEEYNFLVDFRLKPRDEYDPSPLFWSCKFDDEGIYYFDMKQGKEEKCEYSRGLTLAAIPIRMF